MDHKVPSDFPRATLFMLMSVDGKISTGSVDARDFDTDLPSVPGVVDGLQQYYDLEQQTDLASFNTGRCMAKVGWNEPKKTIDKLPVTFVFVDNKPHLTELGVSNLLRHAKKLLIVTTNNQHPAHKLADENLEVMYYPKEVDLKDLFRKLKSKGIDTVTIQSGGEMNAALLRAGLINFVSIVVAPLLVGGRATSTLIDGDSLITLEDLQKLRPLKLLSTTLLNASYVHVRYEVINDGRE